MVHFQTSTCIQPLRSRSLLLCSLLHINFKTYQAKVLAFKRCLTTSPFEGVIKIAHVQSMSHFTRNNIYYKLCKLLNDMYILNHLFIVYCEYYYHIFFLMSTNVCNLQYCESKKMVLNREVSMTSRYFLGDNNLKFN